MKKTSVKVSLQQWDLPLKINIRKDTPRRSTGPLIVFSNNRKNGISDIRDIERRIMSCPWYLGYGSSKVIENDAIQ